MGYQNIQVTMPTEFSSEELRLVLSKKLKIQNFEFSIVKQSLDARNKNDIHWIIKVDVISDELKNTDSPIEEIFEIPKIHKDKHVAVVGSGPAGYFCALALQDSGFKVTIFEKGPEVYERTKAVKHFEKTGELNERANYAFGEGGAGTFSDGKLTSRTKSITNEKKYINEKLILYGAPDEIRYLAKPHLGTNLLTKILKNLRNDFISKGGVIHFNTEMNDFYIESDKVTSIETEKGKFDADFFVFAIGHSEYPTYKNMIRKGVKFNIKSFAIGSRVEHYQKQINVAQWGRESLAGVKSAEYALTFNQDNALPVYSFCMCPGGMVVPAAPVKGLNIVNGMSNYKRNSPFANSAIVAGINLNEYLNKEVSPSEALDWLTLLEKKYFDFSNSYDAPSVKVSDFINKKTTSSFGDSSYPFKLITADFRELLPKDITDSMVKGLLNFSKKMKGFEDGYLIGLESKTSSPIQADRNGVKCKGFENFYIAGEGSGLSGGIVSSAADGIKVAMDIIKESM